MLSGVFLPGLQTRWTSVSSFWLQHVDTSRDVTWLAAGQASVWIWNVLNHPQTGDQLLRSHFTCKSHVFSLRVNEMSLIHMSRFHWWSPDVCAAARPQTEADVRWRTVWALISSPWPRLNPENKQGVGRPQPRLKVPPSTSPHCWDLSKHHSPWMSGLWTPSTTQHTRPC